MAVAFESIQTTAYTSSGTLTITKPVSLAVGDLMIAVIHGNIGGGITPPSGWGTIATINAGDPDLLIYYIIATSTEVAAANFSWTVTGGNYLGGSIARFTGQHSTNPVAIFATDADTGTATPAFTSTVTPNDASSLLLFCLGTYVNTSTGRTASGYAIVTSNPSWTERFDITVDTGSTTYQVSLATATRPEITATGNASVTMNGSCTNLGNVMVIIRPQITVTATETETVVDTVTKKPTKIFSETESVTDTVTTSEEKVWNEETKHSNSWTHQQKS
jgi:hypothetical protein